MKQENLMPRKKKISEGEIRRMHTLSLAGKSDGRIAREMGVHVSRVQRALALVAPDGRVMQSPYGYPQNNPCYTRHGPAVGLVDEIQPFIRARVLSPLTRAEF